MTCWPGGSAWNASQRLLGEARPCRRDGAVPVVRASCCTPSPPTSSSTWATTVWTRDHRRHGDPCATPSRRPQGPGHVRLRQDQAGRRAIHGPHGRRGASAVAARPGRAVAPTSPRADSVGLVHLLADGPFVEILADADYQGLGARSDGRVVTPPHRKFKKKQTSTCRGQPCTRSSGVRVSRPDRRFRPGRPSPGSRSRP